MGTHEEMRKQVKGKFRPESRDHKLCLEKLEETEKIVGEMEKRLQAALEEAEGADARLEAKDTVYSEERTAILAEHAAKEKKWEEKRRDLEGEVKRLEGEVKHERHRSTQALDVSQSASSAMAGIGRLLHVIVDNDVMESLRLAGSEQRAEARERVRHRRPG